MIKVLISHTKANITQEKKNQLNEPVLQDHGATWL